MTNDSFRYDLYSYCIRLQGKNIKQTTKLISHELRTVMKDVDSGTVAQESVGGAQQYVRGLQLLQIILHNGVIPGRCSPSFLNSVSALLEQFGIGFHSGKDIYRLTVLGDSDGEGAANVLQFLQELVGGTLTARYFFQSIDLKVAIKQTEIERIRQIVLKLHESFPFWLFFMTRKNGNLRHLLDILSRYSAEGRSVKGDSLMVALQEKWFPAMHWMCCYAGFSNTEIRTLLSQTIDYLYPPMARTPLITKLIDNVYRCYHR